MSASVPQVTQSRVIYAPIAKVWATLRSCDFKFWKLVDKVELKNGSDSEVGASRIVHFKDGMKQEFKIVEISDLKHSIAFEVIDSEPAMHVMSVLHTLKVRSVTHDDSSYVEWSSEFSTDADQQVIQDSRFKKIDGLKDLSEFVKA
ncbi:hypothetical protein DSO57_1010854 [Entomophthora muscae]|uniref:Uncharacterized protein n=2 Tax=Entomophthora muscae TaxID=34485 RepID=A0ACC2TTU4_9FUNG|nr:hypothetical protein DSO57_1019713 [Entomophthora muscae]KAJ9078034.1 hypothetical protein DSO57_1010854 [Entomophthora muscae]